MINNTRSVLNTKNRWATKATSKKGTDPAHCHRYLSSAHPVGQKPCPQRCHATASYGWGMPGH